MCLRHDEHCRGFNDLINIAEWMYYTSKLTWSLTHPSGVVERKERMIDDERSAQLLEGTYSASGARLSRTDERPKVPS